MASGTLNITNNRRLFTCGDGVVETGEEGDNSGIGCTNCVIDYGYKCPSNVCTTECGDGK